jgi:hypothetical protein
MRRKLKARSKFEILLRALVPFTEENLTLTYKPAKFFANLEKATGSSRHSLESMVSRGVKQGYIKRDGGIPILTAEGKRRIQTIKNGEEMRDGNYFVVLYDIPEFLDGSRRRLAHELRVREFKQYQKSFWISEVNYSEEIIDIIAELNLGKYVTLGTFAKTFGFSQTQQII